MNEKEGSGKGVKEERLPTRQSYRSYPLGTQRSRGRARGGVVLLVPIPRGRYMPNIIASFCNTVNTLISSIACICICAPKSSSMILDDG